MTNLIEKVKDFFKTKLESNTQRVILAVVIFAGLVVLIPLVFKLISFLFSVLAAIFVPVIIIVGLAIIGLYVYHTAVKNRNI